MLETNESAAAAQAESRIPLLEADGVRVQNSGDPTQEIKKSPAPFFHALRKKVRKALWEAYVMFVAAFQQAAERWRAGDRDRCAPSRSFPPRLPFVTA